MESKATIGRRTMMLCANIARVIMRQATHFPSFNNLHRNATVSSGHKGEHACDISDYRQHAENHGPCRWKARPYQPRSEHQVYIQVLYFAWKEPGNRHGLRRSPGKIPNSKRYTVHSPYPTETVETTFRFGPAEFIYT